MPKWIPYGDVNPIEHGGGVYRELSPGVFSLIDFTPFEEQQDTGWMNAIEVDTHDSWIEGDAVCSFADVLPEQRATITFALACVAYYGVQNFGGSLDMHMLLPHDTLYMYLRDLDVEGEPEPEEPTTCPECGTPLTPDTIHIHPRAAAARQALYRAISYEDGEEDREGHPDGCQCIDCRPDKHRTP